MDDPDIDKLKVALNNLCGEANEAASLVRRLYKDKTKVAKLRVLAKIMEMVDEEFPGLMR